MGVAAVVQVCSQYNKPINRIAGIISSEPGSNMVQGGTYSLATINNHARFRLAIVQPHCRRGYGGVVFGGIIPTKL